MLRSVFFLAEISEGCLFVNNFYFSDGLNHFFEPTIIRQTGFHHDHPALLALADGSVFHGNINPVTKVRLPAKSCSTLP